MPEIAPENVPVVPVIPPVEVIEVASTPPNATLPALPEKTDDVSVASAIKVNLLVESSKPKKPVLAPPLLYKNLIPLSRLSSEPDSPNSKIGSSIDTVVEFTVVVVPLTVKFPDTTSYLNLQSL